MFEIIIVALISAIIIVYLKSANSELYIFALIASGIIILSLSLQYLSETFIIINQIIEASGIDREFYIIIFI